MEKEEVQSVFIYTPFGKSEQKDIGQPFSRVIPYEIDKVKSSRVFLLNKAILHKIIIMKNQLRGSSIIVQ